MKPETIARRQREEREQWQREREAFLRHWAEAQEAYGFADAPPPDVRAACVDLPDGSFVAVTPRRFSRC